MQSGFTRIPSNRSSPPVAAVAAGKCCRYNVEVAVAATVLFSVFLVYYCLVIRTSAVSSFATQELPPVQNSMNSIAVMQLEEDEQRKQQEDSMARVRNFQIQAIPPLKSLCFENGSLKIDLSACSVHHDKPLLKKVLQGTTVGTEVYAVQRPGVIPVEQVTVRKPVASKKVFIAITTSWTLKSYLSRKALRETWVGSIKEMYSEEVDYMFFLGTPRTELYSRYADALAAEMEQHKDMMILDFHDSYRNLSLKTTKLLLWTSANREFEYLIKTDDDSFVHVSYILSELEHNASSTQFWAGSLNNHYFPIHCQNSKVKECLQGGEDVNFLKPPRWLNGWGYIFSKDLVDAFAEKFLDDECTLWPIIFLEDINTAYFMTSKFLLEPTQFGEVGLSYSFKCSVCESAGSNLSRLAFAHPCDPRQMKRCHQASLELCTASWNRYDSSRQIRTN